MLSDNFEMCGDFSLKNTFSTLIMEKKLGRNSKVVITKQKKGKKINERKQIADLEIKPMGPPSCRHLILACCLYHALPSNQASNPFPW